MESENTQAPPRHDEAYDLGSFRVLVVEDSPFIGNLLSSALMEMGVGQVMLASSVNDAKEKILSSNAIVSKQNIDVIILDWLMPDGEGSELLEWVRGHKSDTIKFLPTIVCSAFASKELVNSSRDLGANEAMVKPVSAEKLAHRILYVIDKPRPFISCKSFFGPDRRRKMEKFVGGERRHTKEEEIEEEHEQLQ